MCNVWNTFEILQEILQDFKIVLVIFRHYALKVYGVIEAATGDVL